MGWQTYNLDRAAQSLVLKARERDRQSLNQSFKMREAVAYGLERFWGEQFRLAEREPEKAQYWRETWGELVTAMQQAGVTIPNDAVGNDVTKVRAMAEKLWQLHQDDQRAAIAVLTQLCDCLVWWTQRYKLGRDES
ncbi:MAG: hypothetical protein HC910_17100 [Spirulinaceae cyanobacterium SM2_1_0]|nr:hypothetical protein [Spirulinaceae cyanobacterium SM2_1_0]